MTQLGNVIDTNYDFTQLPELIHLAGVSFENRQELIKNLKEEIEIKLIRDPKNPYDKNAIKVYVKQNKEEIQIGWIPKEISQILAAEIDAGIKWYGKIKKIIGGEMQTKGLLVNLYYVK